ncbi:SDR family NAD(P)-dependent oxidoreductase [Roseateles sp. BYS78W]|uniref:SDR family NAD(P)-dependent oxidoreductase n=1 Tax=Pelomonas candidula TaxID=3299025 RepID=A0ABW7H9Z9_9BURK
MRMQGNTILVAGGAGGIGRGLAELLCRLGNEVIVFGLPAGASLQQGLRVVDIDLADPWSVAAFSEQVAAVCPGLNMLVDIAIAFPVKYLPGMQALLGDDETPSRLEAHRLGMQHLTGALLPHLRKREHSAVWSLSVGPAFAPLHAGRGTASPRAATAGSAPAFALSVTKRWASARIEVVDIAVPSRGHVAMEHRGMSRGEFVSRLAGLLAEGLQEEAALARLRALWPLARPAVRETEDDDSVSEAV